MRKIIESTAEASRVLDIVNCTIPKEEATSQIMLKQSKLDCNSFIISVLEVQLNRLYLKNIKNDLGETIGKEKAIAKMAFELAISAYPYADRSKNEVIASFKRVKIHKSTYKKATESKTLSYEFRLPEEQVFVDLFCKPFKFSDTPIFVGVWNNDKGVLSEYTPEVKVTKAKALVTQSSEAEQANEEFLRFLKAAEHK
jgi:hypothetical protein